MDTGKSLLGFALLVIATGVRIHFVSARYTPTSSTRAGCGTSFTFSWSSLRWPQRS